MVMLSDELEGILSGKWNSERFLVFQATVLQKTELSRTSREVRVRLDSRMDVWEQERIEWLVQDTERTSRRIADQGNTCPDPPQMARVYARLMLQGKVRAAVRWATERGQGGVLAPESRDERSGKTVMEILREKHPANRDLAVEHLTEYESLPERGTLEVPVEAVELTARRLNGSGCPGGTDAQNLQGWLLRFGPVSRKLQRAVAALAEWMGSPDIPWAAYRGMMAGRLIALDKSPGVRPVGIGEVWRRLIAKAVLVVTGEEATEACG